eukprot:CAMPEP_0119005722 /NCGR_PEP_ID=MMETSP1176-20130426/1889_1 /TAXON_ID=265551 /ORGANISM="Synedropsis recta cf, Strain CCMP1620" /LENGTH=598 /DNA_ID=CAMNT_0006957563 /DNA_START=124 /DNA_END=1917 /DNA_ORIENTATION=+
MEHQPAKRKSSSAGKHSSSKYDKCSSASPSRPQRRGSSSEKHTSSDYDRASAACPTRPQHIRSRNSDQDKSLVGNQQPMKRRGSVEKQSSSEYARASSASPTRPRRVSSRNSDRDRSLVVGHKQPHQPKERRSSSGGRRSSSEYGRASSASPTRPQRSNSRDSNDSYNRESPPSPRTTKRRTRNNEQKQKSADEGARLPSKTRCRTSGGKELTDAHDGRRTTERRTSNENRKCESGVVRRSISSANKQPSTKSAFRDARAPNSHERMQQQRLGDSFSNVAHNRSNKIQRRRNSLDGGGGNSARQVSFSHSAPSLNRKGPSNGELETSFSNVAHNHSNKIQQRRNSLDGGGGSSARRVSFSHSAPSLNHNTPSNGELETFSNVAHNPSNKMHRGRNSLDGGGGNNARQVYFSNSAPSLHRNNPSNGERATFQQQAMFQERLQQAKGAYNDAAPVVVDDSNENESDGEGGATKKWGRLRSLMQRRNSASNIIQQDAHLTKVVGCFDRYEEGKTKTKGYTAESDGTPGTHLDVDPSGCRLGSTRRQSMPMNFRGLSNKNAVQQGGGGRRDGSHEAFRGEIARQQQKNKIEWVPAIGPSTYT